MSKTFFTISEISMELDLPSSVLRFWEKQFKQIHPKRHNKRRYYTNADVSVIKQVKDLLYNKGYTIEGAKKELANTMTSTSSSQEKQEKNSMKPNTSDTITKNYLLSIRSKLQEISDIL